MDHLERYWRRKRTARRLDSPRTLAAAVEHRPTADPSLAQASPHQVMDSHGNVRDGPRPITP